MRVRGLGGVDHAGDVDEIDVLEVRPVAHLDLEVLEEGGAHRDDVGELRGKLADGGGTVVVLLDFAEEDDGEAVVGRGDAGVLHGRIAEKVVDDGGLAGGVVPEEDGAWAAADGDLGPLDV